MKRLKMTNLKGFAVKCLSVIMLLTVGCLAALVQTPVAFGDDYYFIGGSGTPAVVPGWDMTSWNSPSITDPAINWVNGNTSVARIGYLGTGGYTAGTGYSQATPINLTLASDVTAQELYFGLNGANTAYCNYQLTGHRITLGDSVNPGKITIDLNGVGGNGWGFINSNLNVASGRDLEVSSINLSSGFTYASTYAVLSGTNSFGNLVVDAALGTSNTSRNWVDFAATSACPNNTNVSLGLGAGVATMANDGTNININNVQLNKDSVPFFAGATYGTLGSCNGSIGAGDGYGVTNRAPQITVNGVISGDSDLIFSSAYSSGGCGTVVLNAHSSYTGNTFMSQFSSRGDTGNPMAFVRLGINNALPTSTNLIFGYANGNSGCFDLAGYNQQVASIGSINKGSGANYCGGVTNSGGTLSTLTINNTSLDPINARFDAVIGKLPSFAGTPAQRATTNDNIALHLAAGNNGALTIGVPLYGATPGGPWTGSNTYSGGTIIDGGYLFAANGATGSASGTGPVIVNNGGTLGGSTAGGSVGAPTTGLVTINNGGSLLPGGGTLSSSGFAPSVGPTFNVLGGLTLNDGSSVSFNFLPGSIGDKVSVAGALTLPLAHSGAVTININDAGTLQNGATLFSFGTLTNPFDLSELLIGAGSTPPPLNHAYSFVQNGNEIDLLADWRPSFKKWYGNLAGGTWDVGTTANFRFIGAAALFYNSEAVVFDDTATNTSVNIATDGVQPGSPLNFSNKTKTYTISGGPITGPIDLTVSGGGQVRLNNTNTYSGFTNISNNSVLRISSPDAVQGTAGINVTDTSTLWFASSMTLNKDIKFYAGSSGSGASPVLDTRSNNVEISGTLSSELYGGTTNIGFTKLGAGTLTLSNPGLPPGNPYGGITNINNGTVCLNAVDTSVQGQSYSALGFTNVRVYSGGMLQLDNVGIGVAHNKTTSGQVGWVDLFSGTTLKGTGNASYDVGDITPTLNFSTGYSPGSVTFATIASTDTLTIKRSVKQYDPGYITNNYGNWDPATRQSDPTKLITAHVMGLGRVVLQDGATSSTKTFGGEWSVDSGTLQVGPFVANPTPDTDPNSTTGWTGPSGQPLNALGFKTPNGQSSSGYGDPDLPNAVTVHTNGTLAIAVDQVNANANGAGLGFNGTPNYIRNPITLAGGSIAATGSEVDFGINPTDPQAVPNGTPVEARLGGDFTVAPGTSRVLVYNPVITGDVGFTAGPRTVSLVEGSRTLTYTSDPWWIGTSGTILYSTNWNGTLIVDPGTTTGGGVFNISRTAGNVSVTPGAELDIMAHATVNLSGANVLSDGTHSVNVNNNGLFDVLNGNHQVDNITGSGTVVVEHDAALTAQSITTNTLTIGAGATLTILPIPGGPLAGRTCLTPVPEPSTLVLLSLAGLAGLFSMYFRIKL